MIIKFELPPILICIDMGFIKLTKMKWKPIKDVKYVGIITLTKSWDVLIIID